MSAARSEGGAEPPAWMPALFGAACVVAGAALVIRPFTSLGVLVVLVGFACVVTGLARWSGARPNVRPLDWAVVAVWVVAGTLVWAVPGLTVRGVAVLAGVAMALSGGAEAATAIAGRVDDRLASALRGVAGVVFGALALLWPSVTVLVVSVVFGVRTVFFGLATAAEALWPRFAGRQTRGRRTPGLVRRSFRLVTAAAALAVAVGLAGASAAVRGAGPQVDDFYAAPDTIPDEPGRLLRAEPFDRAIPTGARGWRILYTTTAADGVPAVASGLVVVPDRPEDGPSPVVAWAHGTTGIDRSCAPSLLDDPFEGAAFYALDLVVDRGWALVAPDYVGLGTEGPHPYLVGEPAGRSVLDAVRAARHLDGADLDERTVVWGHSQGGGAALWTGELAEAYAPDAGVVGVAALAPASDLPELMSGGTLPGTDMFGVYVLEGYAAVYPDVTVEDYVAPTARASFDAIAGRCVTEPAFFVSVLEAIAVGAGGMFSRDLLDGPLGERLAQHVPTGPFPAPVFIGQGEDDWLVSPEIQAGYVAARCAEGQPVDYRTYPGRDHIGLVRRDSPLLAELADWTADRFAGLLAPDRCPA